MYFTAIKSSLYHFIFIVYFKQMSLSISCLKKTPIKFAKGQVASQVYSSIYM